MKFDSLTRNNQTLKQNPNLKKVKDKENERLPIPRQMFFVGEKDKRENNNSWKEKWETLILYFFNFDWNNSAAIFSPKRKFEKFLPKEMRIWPLLLPGL